MKKINIFAILVCMALIGSSALTSAQEKIKYTKPKKQEPRNNWSLGLNYGENGFGPYVSFYSALGRSTDLAFNLAFSGVTDDREVERYDLYGNSVTYGKINRVFMMPLSIGIRQELFKNDIEGDFLPIFNIGIAPTLVLTNPYDQSFFNAINETQTHFAFGGFTGFGVNFSQSKTLSMSINLNYYYLPIIGGGVQSLYNSTINNVGGFQLAFGIIFLQ